MSTYDPLYQANCKGQPLPSSYWASQFSLETDIKQPTKADMYDVIIIGGGFTGLLTAFYLATMHNQKVCVLEANQVGFGASARNAGFALPTTGRLTPLSMVKKWGLNIASQVYNEYQNGVTRLERLIQEHSIDCDKQSHGYLKIAHSKPAMDALYQGYEFAKKAFFDEKLSVITPNELKEHYLNMPNTHGAVRNQHGFGLNPLKLLSAYKTVALKAGVDIFEHSLAEHMPKMGNTHTVKVNDVLLRANKLLITANAYGSKRFHPAINHKYIPILSSILVTRPLTCNELAETGLKTHQVMMDTRTLKYYYRLLPDNRLLFGGRGAVYGKDQNKQTYQTHLKGAMQNGFPALNSIETDYYWHGYIAATLDDHPHIYFQDGVGYAIGYCGAGVAFSTQAAYRLSQMTMSLDTPSLPIYQSAAPKVPFARLSRLGQLSFYHYAQLKDRLF
ncbi:NAD(P)/FAD-dependent oxidoreductase [Pseudoalteromonas umbrosa]|uniref:NAD(P)/FAD-dependent oxidoreductase n=1 Tax=Pseudoalteromonas umbrosa TaxID=3048489 RepID=UPI0024C223C1|nr:FAD-dependent oxidoreductase [Pseudoalteromonas sp. B95]MDK1288336.1 FAD-dependent oxidoreductase [Pseudoalteromonas sp. B95]